MISKKSPFLFVGSSHPALGQELCAQGQFHLGQISLKKFPDEEISVEILEDVSDQDVFVLQSMAHHPNDYLVELLIIVDALKRLSPKRITAIIPYFGYSRQDRKDCLGSPITAKLVANLLTAAGITCLITVHLHSDSIEGFFEIPVYHLQSYHLLCQNVKEHIGIPQVVVAPDTGSIKIAEKMAKLFNTDLAVIRKQRLNPSQVESNLIGDVKNKDVLIIDDLCSTGATLTAAATLCEQYGARRVNGVIIHGLFVDHALEKIANSPLERLLTTNTIAPSFCREMNPKIHYLSISEWFQCKK